MRSNTRAVFADLLSLIWFVLCLSIFVLVSRIGLVQQVLLPNWSGLAAMLSHLSPVRYMFDLLSALLGVLLFSLACLAFGLGVLSRTVQSQASKLALGITAFLVGEILFSILFLTLLSLYRLTPTLTIFILVLGFMLGLPSLKTFLTSFPRHIDLSDFHGSERAILALCITGLTLGILLSSTRLGYDAAAEYFSHAKIMAVSHLPVFFYPKDYFVVSSFHPGILFTALIQVFGDQAARLLSWMNGAIIVVTGLALGQELGLGPRARLWFLTLMISTTAFVDLLGDGKVEIISTAPILAAVYWMVRSIEQPSKSLFLLIGLLSGFAIIARPYNIFLVSVFIFMFLLSQAFIKYRHSRTDFRSFAQPILWMILPLLALGIFHLLQNWIWLKNPIAPIAYARGLKSSYWHAALAPSMLIVYRLFYPFTLTFITSTQALGNISPLFVGSLPLLLSKKVRERLQLPINLRWLTIIATVTLLMWVIFFFTVLEIRYVLFLWVILFLAISQVLDRATQYVVISIRPLIGFTVILLLIILNLRTLMIAMITFFPSSETHEAECYDTNLCDILAAIDQPAAPGDRVFALHGYRYYLRPDLFACSSRVAEYGGLEPLARANSSEFWVELYRRGFRFVMFESILAEARYQFGQLPDLSTVPDWLHIRVLYSSNNGTQRVYELEAVNPPISPEISCKQDAAGTWQLTSAPR